MEVPCYVPKLLFELNEQRKRDFFCDCSILVEGRVFKAHRNVLFAGSGYFRALLVHDLQDSGQRCSTASLDIVTADAFSIILDFLYSGRLALNRSNAIEVMSAASYLQMTDLVNFCKGYIRSSLEILNKEKDSNTAKDGEIQDGGVGPADSGTSAVTMSGDAAAASLQPRSQVAEADEGSGSCTEPVTSARAPLSIAVTPTPGNNGGRNSNCHSRETFESGNERQKEHVDPTNLSSSSSSALTPELVNPKIEYDPDDDSEDLAMFAGPSLHNAPQSRLLPPSPSPSNPFGTFNARQLMGMLGTNDGPSPPEERADQHFYQGLSSGAGDGRMDDSLGLVGSSVIEIQADWIGEGAGDSLVVPVKLHKCPYCPYTAKQKGILKRHIRCHTGERPFPCRLCGKRFTRQEHLRSHAQSVHRHFLKVSCRSCRRSFTGSSVSLGLRRFGICDSCNCHDDSAPGDPVSGGESMDRTDGAADWSSFMDDVDEVEVGRVEDLVEKQMLERQLSVCTEPVTSARAPLSVAVTPTPGNNGGRNSNCHSRETFESGNERQKEHVDPTNLSSSSSSALTPELVNPKIEYDPDDDSEDLAMFAGPSLHNAPQSRLLPPSPSPSNPFGTFNARQLMGMLGTNDGPSPPEERADQHFYQGLIRRRRSTQRLQSAV
ncbi:zinc finger and BTB domain-containing protein 8B [Brachionichthys hirsutus]|uniref:zinc finger and BTB domain-containing protein 8B n=1 Tax=Brachionichthys hirsutus TaxID=412623 RepID=UPI003604B551